uniref:Ataxin 10 n=1 Tax=Salarias fasciatus TaxID=181472 RepID=A0A672H4S1_SALFA
MALESRKRRPRPPCRFQFIRHLHFLQLSTLSSLVLLSMLFFFFFLFPQVRELEGIPLILDNCNIDSNNPFISQWAIFAIRNLLENNVQNQELVASLERRGKADYSALRQLGFLVEERDGSLLLKTVRKDS